MMVASHPPLAGSLRACLRACAGLSLALLAGQASAQESIRPSNTGAQAAAARRPTDTSINYNIKAGPVTFDASASVDVEFNDNIGLSEKNRESDFIFRPTLQVDSRWRVSQLNTIRFAFGVGFAKYAEHNDLDTRSLLLDPGSEVSFDIYIGGVLRVNVHDRFSIVQNPVDEPSLSNTARFDRFQNAAGFTAFWDLNDLDVVFGYDHFNYHALGKNFDFLDRSEEQIFASSSLLLSDALRVGVEASVALIDYRFGFNNDGTTWTGGSFLEATLSPYTKLRASAGYQGMQFDTGGESGDTSDNNGWYAGLTLAQRVNQYWSHSISAGRESRLGLTVNYAEYIYARYVTSYRLNTRMNVGAEAFLENVNESGSAQQLSEEAFRWGLGASFDWKLGRQVTLGVRYRYVNKDSDLALRSYYQNVGMLTINYDF